jgi:hypothetical protein
MQKKKAFVQQFARKFHILFDEDFMIGCENFAWLLHHLKEGCCGLNQPGIDIDYHGLYPPESAVRFAGGVPIIATYGDIDQLPVVGDFFREHWICGCGGIICVPELFASGT